MTEAIGVASAITTLVATAYTSRKFLHETFNEMIHTQRDLHIISRDLEDFYLALGTIQAIFDDNENARGTMRSAPAGNLTMVL